MATGPQCEVEVADEPERSRYVARLAGEEAGFVQYLRLEDRTRFIHTEVPDRFGGRGVGSALIRTALDTERAAGRAVEPRCPFVSRFIARHPDYGNLVPREHRHLLDR